jgi:DNA polymerase-3 subunit epsilon
VLRQYFIRAHLGYQSYRCSDKRLRAYQQACLGLLALPISEAPLLALDLEMTGLDAKKDQIISIGIIPIIKGRIELSKGQHKLIKIAGSVGQSATIHGVVDNDLAQALSLSDALKWLFKEATGSLLVAHHAPLDLSFIEHALLKENSKKCRLFAIDTLHIEHQRLLRKQLMIKEGELRLSSCRSRYNLPYYEGHNALIDALACAELLLAQVSKMGGLNKIKVSELLR